MIQGLRRTMRREKKVQFVTQSVELDFIKKTNFFSQAFRKAVPRKFNTIVRTRQHKKAE